MSHARLDRLWREHCATPFPAIADVDLAAGFAEYDGFVAGVVSTTVAGERSSFAGQLEVDDALTRRASDTGDAEAISSISRLNEMAELVGGDERRKGSA